MVHCVIWLLANSHSNYSPMSGSCVASTTNMSPSSVWQRSLTGLHSSMLRLWSSGSLFRDLWSTSRLCCNLSPGCIFCRSALVFGYSVIRWKEVESFIFRVNPDPKPVICSITKTNHQWGHSALYKCQDHIFSIILWCSPSNWPGNILVVSKPPDGSSRIFLTMELVEYSSPGPNMANLGVFLGHNDLSMEDKWWKLMLDCLTKWFTVGEHRRYLQK